MGVQHDFLSWTSFPSSIKLVNYTDVHAYVWHEVVRGVSVKPGAKLTVQCNTKQVGRATLPPPPPPTISAGIRIDLYTPAALGKYQFLFPIANRGVPFGAFDWRTDEVIQTVPADATVLMIRLYALGKRGDTIWFDDLKIYQDDQLIYSDDFSNWDPVIGAGVGAPIGVAIGYFLKEPLGPMVSEAVGAVLGGALGGGVGLLTGLGIIPVPQIPIPAFGAAPEGPGAPARLGKYQITG